MKVAIIGTHGVGKTTLALTIAARQKLLGKSVKFIGETARDCPFGINDKCSVETVLWIYHRQMQRELEASKKFDTVICDRSVIDSFVYGRAMELDPVALATSYNAADAWMYSYDQLIFVRKGSCPPKADGTRDTDIAYQEKVQRLFEQYIETQDAYLTISEITADEIFGDIEKCQRSLGFLQ